MDASAEALISVFSVVLGQESGDRRMAEQHLTALEILDCKLLLFRLSEYASFK